MIGPGALVLLLALAGLLADARLRQRTATGGLREGVLPQAGGDELASTAARTPAVSPPTATS